MSTMTSSSIRRYTIEQLLHLRNSPAAIKPDNLPAIEQWIEYVYLDVDGSGTREKLRIPHSESQQPHQQHQQKQGNATTTGASAPGGRPPRASGGVGVGEASPMGNFSTGQRPSLKSLKSSAARSGEDITLGPPKTLFASSRTTSRIADFEKPPTSLTEAALKEDTDGHRNSRTFGDKQTNRKSTSANDTETKHTAESWTVARERRAMGGDDEKTDGNVRNGKYGRHERDQQDSERRNGYGDRPDSRWHRDERREQNGDKPGGWRERERERRDRDWGRGHSDTKKPEWMDEPVANLDDDMVGEAGMPKNQEEFEKWKQQQHARNKKSADLDTDAVLPNPPPAAQEVKAQLSSRHISPLKLEGVTNRPFGVWGESKPSGGASSDNSQTPAKSAGARGKTSRFMPLFKKDEPREEPSSTVAAAQSSGEDKAGFDRILQMLGGTGVDPRPTPNESVNEPASPPPRQVSNGGGKPRSRFTGFFDRTPKSPEVLQSPPGTVAHYRPIESDALQGGRGMRGEPAHSIPMRTADLQSTSQPSRLQSSVGAMPSEPTMPTNGAREQRPPPPGRMNDLFLEPHPPSRGASTPDLNIQNLLAARPNPKQQVDNQNSKFLLDLLQTKGPPRPPSQQARPSADNGFKLWREQPPNLPETYAPQQHAPPPPGSFEDQLLRNHQMQEMPAHETPGRRQSQRAPPPGFYDEPALFQHHVPVHQNQPPQPQSQHHQRPLAEPTRQFISGPPGSRRMSGRMGLPQMQIPGQQSHPQYPLQVQPPYPGEFLQSPNGITAPPPPGFNPHMPRHPPGIHNIPSIFSAPQQQQQQPQRDLRDPRLPPLTAGFGGPGAGSEGVGMLQHQQQMMSPPAFYNGSAGMPPGFMQHLRSPVYVGGEGGLPATAAAGGRGMARAYEGFGVAQGR
ncbi:hypothetical protein LTR82_009063 [Friedmanniomyces endolithicus]|uniref:Uncharacterized protein n=1 Tax=Friedmanniomyces endolithicus TaxID=329885 RepID=A0AAN6FNY7_9PEZI|nr:hypothetical protein LTR82_009063 [Friedmanniomyces endolithicus]